jgi:two-component system sensor histidine kinase KdpD
MQHTAPSHGTNFSATVRPLAYVGAVGVVFATLGLAFLVNQLMPHASLSLLFLTGVLIISARTGLGPSLIASVLSFLAFNFFFTPPYYTFEVADDGDVATLLFFLLMAAITGNLAARMHQEMAKRRASLQRISNLYEFSRRMSSAAGTEAVLEALADHLAQSMDRSVAVLIAKPEGVLAVKARAGQPKMLPQADIEAAWSQNSLEPIMIESWHFLKLSTNREPMGMVAVHGQADGEQIDLARSLCDQAAVALDRTQLVADLEQARLVSETEQLRSALLSSISHDLRTPLASITGSTTSLLEYGESFSDENRKELLATIVEEAQRLDRHIQNLLDMTRLGQGSLTLRRDWVDLHDIVSSAVGRLRDALKGIPIDIEISGTVPLLWVHGVLIEQALVNLLDNAVRFSPADGHITITAGSDGGRVEIDVCDDGPGIPENERERIFDMFYTVRQGDRGNRQGTGLGLAICRGIVAAHGGNVTVHDRRNGRGTRVRIALPIIQPDGMSGA